MLGWDGGCGSGNEPIIPHAYCIVNDPRLPGVDLRLDEALLQPTRDKYRSVQRNYEKIHISPKNG